MQNRISKVKAIFSQLHHHVWNGQEIGRKVKKIFYKTAVWSVVYVSENWPLNARNLRDISLFDNAYLQNILKIWYSDRISNAEMCQHCRNLKAIAMTYQTEKTTLPWKFPEEIWWLCRHMQMVVKASLLDWSMCPGGQLKNWWTTVKNSLDTIGGVSKVWPKVGEMAEELEQDRKKWDSAIRSLLDS